MNYPEGYTYSHSSNEIARSLSKPKRLCDHSRYHIGDKCLDDEDDRNDGEFDKLVRTQLGSQFREDCTNLAHNTVNTTWHDVLRHGVKSATFKLATNFWFSALNMPCRATMYPGKLTQTTSKTASNTSNIRCPSSGCSGPASNVPANIARFDRAEMIGP